MLSRPVHKTLTIDSSHINTFESSHDVTAEGLRLTVVLPEPSPAPIGKCFTACFNVCTKCLLDGEGQDLQLVAFLLPPNSSKASGVHFVFETTTGYVLDSTGIGMLDESGNVVRHTRFEAKSYWAYFQTMADTSGFDIHRIQIEYRKWALWRDIVYIRYNLICLPLNTLQQYKIEMHLIQHLWDDAEDPYERALRISHGLIPKNLRDKALPICREISRRHKLDCSR